MIPHNSLPEFRKDPISGTWVIFSSERDNRPYQWTEEGKEKKEIVCPFCPGQEHQTPPEIYAERPDRTAPDQPGWSIRVFPNKFPALKRDGYISHSQDGIFESITGIGAHEIIVETNEHDKHLTDLSEAAIQKILWTFKNRILQLEADPEIKYILLFKNHGREAGASIAHSHTQLIATPILPKRIEEELSGIQKHFNKTRRCIFCEVISEELQRQERLVSAHQYFVVFEPYASRFPYETWILPKQHQHRFEDIDEIHIVELASVLKQSLQRIMAAMNNPAYNLVLHTSPLKEFETENFHWHFEILPMRSNIAGFERGAGFFINSILPEKAAVVLREIRL